MKKILAFLTILSTFTFVFAQSTDDVPKEKVTIDKTIQKIVPENQRIATNPETGKPRPASVRIEYSEQYDEIRVYYTCMEVAFDKTEATVTISEVVKDFEKEHNYFKHTYLGRDKTRHFKDSRGIKMAEFVSYIKLYR
ncbi:MAG: hypothetical protein MJ169_03605 [Treponema sp.]|nr:hypothetical protein [Treponema sp.]